MQYEPNFDNAEGFKKIEKEIVFGGKVISKQTQTFFWNRLDLGPIGSSAYDHHGIRTRDAEERIQEAEEEAKRIHRKYHPN